MIPQHYSRWVSSFGHLRVNVHLQLTVAFRSLSRPSSAPCTKASSCVLFVAYSFLKPFSGLSSNYLPYKNSFWLSVLLYVLLRINLCDHFWSRSLFIAFLYFIQSDQSVCIRYPSPPSFTRKTKTLYTNLSLVFTMQLSIFNYERPLVFRALLSRGGLKWTRTIDLALIRRVL